MDSVTKKTRQEGSEVTERRKENVFYFYVTHQTSQKRMPGFVRD